MAVTRSTLLLPLALALSLTTGAAAQTVTLLGDQTPRHSGSGGICLLGHEYHG